MKSQDVNCYGVNKCKGAGKCGGLALSFAEVLALALKCWHCIR